jgi:hypothetical protein
MFDSRAGEYRLADRELIKADHLLEVRRIEHHCLRIDWRRLHREGFEHFVAPDTE